MWTALVKRGGSAVSGLGERGAAEPRPAALWANNYQPREKHKQAGIVPVQTGENGPLVNRIHERAKLRRGFWGHVG
jgi:hypothetical protein